ncbi:unnamed protein product [Urochloa humidicola]
MAVTSSSSGGSGEDIPSENESFESDDLQTPPGADYVISCRSHLSEEQKDRVIALIQDIQPEITVYIAVMQKCHVHPPAPFVEFGSQYAAAVHLPARGQTMVLHCMGKIWKIKMVFQNGRRWFLSGGWSNFVRGNGLRVGDICLFELKDQKKLTMKVHIISREQL